MLLTVVVIQLLDELLSVPVDRITAKHLEAEDAILEAHLVEELGEDDAQRAQRVAGSHLEYLWVASEDLFVHLEDHSLVLSLLLDPLFILTLEQAVHRNFAT